MAVLLDLEGEDQTADHLSGKHVRQRRCSSRKTEIANETGDNVVCQTI